MERHEERREGKTEAGPFIKMIGFDHSLSTDTLMVSEETVPAQGQIANYTAMWGADPTDPEGTTFVALALSPGHSVQLYAYNVALDTLRSYAASLKLASQAEWVAAHQAAGAN